MLLQKRILLLVTGSIAAYKVPELIRMLQKDGALVRVVMTKSATRFVSAYLLEVLIGAPVVVDLFSGGSYDHLEYVQSSDLLVVVPATANFIAKAAAGVADDAVSTIFLAASRLPRVVFPAMNPLMYEDSILQDKVAYLARHGVTMVHPEVGEMACGDVGRGRLPHLEAIVAHCVRATSSADLDCQVLITGGPTREPFDSIRFLSNRSSGKMARALALAAWTRGADVTLVLGPVELDLPILAGLTVCRVETAAEMASQVKAAYPAAQVVIAAAAVADFTFAQVSTNKIRKRDLGAGVGLSLELVPTRDILADLGRCKGERILVGFAAEDQAATVDVQAKLVAKNLDLLVVNTIDESFGHDENQVTIINSQLQKKSWPRLSKSEVSDHIVTAILAARLSSAII